MSGAIDFAAIRAAHPIADTVGRYLELKKQGGEFKARCPFHADRNPSFAVVPRKNKAFCNACGWHGDVIDFVAEFENVDTSEAARRLSGGELPKERPALPELPPDEADEWTVLVPVPDDAPAYEPFATYNPRRAKLVDWSRILTRRDAYRDGSGRLLGYVVRLEIDGEKLTPAVVYAQHQDGRRLWVSGRFPEPRPLQGLDELAKRLTDPVLVVEGEKCRGVAATLLPGFVVVTWPGGTNAVDKADWSPLRGRNVTLWPDADRPGRVAAGEVAVRAQAHTTRILDTAELEALFGSGADVADLVAAGWSRDRVVAWAQAHVGPWVAPKTTTPRKEALKGRRRGGLGEGATSQLPDRRGGRAVRTARRPSMPIIAHLLSLTQYPSSL